MNNDPYRKATVVHQFNKIFDIVRSQFILYAFFNELFLYLNCVSIFTFLRALLSYLQRENNSLKCGKTCKMQECPQEKRAM